MDHTQSERLSTGMVSAASVARWGRRLALPLVLSVAFLFHLLTLVNTPPPFNDEAWFSSHAVGLLQTGYPFGPLDTGIYQRYEGYQHYFPWLHAAIQAVPISLLGYSLLSLRLSSLIGGLLLLLAIWSIGRRLTDWPTATLAVLFVMVTGGFRYSSHLGRPDIWVAAAGYGAIALVLSERMGRWPWRSLVAGLAVGLAFEMHPNAMIFGLAIGGLYLVDHRWRVWHQARCWLFGLGGLVGLLVFFLLRVWPNPRTFAALTTLTFGDTRTPPLLVPGQWLTALLETIEMLALSNIFALPLMGGAVIVLWRQRASGGRRLLLIFGLLFGLCMTLLSYKPGYYVILLAPVAELLVASLVVAALRAWPHGVPLTRALSVVGAGLLVMSLAFNLSVVGWRTQDDYQAVVAKLQQSIPASSLVMGEPKWWVGLHQHRYMAWHQVAYYRRYAPGSSVEEAFAYYRPDILLVDAEMDWQITDEPARLAPWAQLQSLPKREWEPLLQRRARLVTTIETRFFGNLRVYALNWDEPAADSLLGDPVSPEDRS